MADIQPRDLSEDKPVDAYGPGYDEFQIREAVRRLCLHVGFDAMRETLAEIINDEWDRKYG